MIMLDLGAVIFYGIVWTLIVVVAVLLTATALFFVGYFIGYGLTSGHQACVRNRALRMAKALSAHFTDPGSKPDPNPKP